MRNERLNQILTVKINLNALRKVMEDCDEKIVKACVILYHEKKNWRWKQKSVTPQKEKQDLLKIYGAPPAKKTCLDLTREIETYEINDDEQDDDDDYDTTVEDGSNDEDWYIDD